MMTMRPATAICLVAFVVVVALTTTTEAQAAAPAAPAQASPAAAAADFLRGRCTPNVMPKNVAESCYKTLLPEAGSFNGSCMRVIGAATEKMVAAFRALLADLRKLDAGGKYKVGKCMDQAAGFDVGKPEPEMLARIRSLAALGDDNKVDRVYNLQGWLEGVDTQFEDGCMAEVNAIPDSGKLVPTYKDAFFSIQVANGLVQGFSPPGMYDGI